MHSCDVLIVGGGPAGSACAWRLRKHGIPSLVLEAQEFPRTKPCAGWITPWVLHDLEIDPQDYPCSFITFSKIHVEYEGKKGAKPLVLNAAQHSIRRCEFDAWLLQRSGAEVHRYHAREIKRECGWYVIDNQFRCRYLVGAGGTHCPVYRTFFAATNKRCQARRIITLETEFSYNYQDSECRLWFSRDGLPGYSWYVPKGQGWINVGIGGYAEQMRQGKRSLREYWQSFICMLGDKELIVGHEYRPVGYTYYLGGSNGPWQIDGAYITGDAAGIATRDMGEGIGPAIESGIRAADSVATGKSYSLKRISKYSSLARGLRSGIVEMFLKELLYQDWIFGRRWR